MSDTAAATSPGDLLMTAHDQLHAACESIGFDAVPGMLGCSLGTLKLAILGLAEYQHPDVTGAAARGDEPLHAATALTAAAAACTLAAMVVHARLVAMPRTLSVQRTGELLIELNQLGGKLSRAADTIQRAAMKRTRHDA